MELQLLRPLWLLALPAAAQMDAAMGKPLVDGNLAQGSVTIRVVDGELSKPMAGLTVELVAAEGKNLDDFLARAEHAKRRLDALAEGGTRFAHASAHAPWTPAARDS